jgi:hypothetical protein
MFILFKIFILFSVFGNGKGELEGKDDVELDVLGAGMIEVTPTPAAAAGATGCDVNCGVDGTEEEEDDDDSKEDETDIAEVGDEVDTMVEGGAEDFIGAAFALDIDDTVGGRCIED